jgi:ComF family protein
LAVKLWQYFKLYVVSALIKSVFPLKCYSCDRFFYREDKASFKPETDVTSLMIGMKNEPEPTFGKVLHPYLCDRCHQGISATEKPLCLRCGTRFRSHNTEDHVCGKCYTNPGRITMARSVYEYEPPLSGFIPALKYKRKTALAKPLGLLLFLKFIQMYDLQGNAPGYFTEPLVIIPVPLHGKKIRQRGFNQAELLINNWKKLTKNVPYDFSFIVARNVLFRHVYTKPQVGSSLHQRKKNLKNAFGIRCREVIKDKTVLLIDDVYTTGATVEECASVLLKNGAGRVDALTVLRVSD